MSTFKLKNPLLKREEMYILKTFLIALFAASLMFVPVIVAGKGIFFYYGDYNAQQIPFNMTCHSAVRSGDIFWNDYTDLGVNFLGSYSFYVIGSPFFWLTLLFPTVAVPYLLGPLLMLKFALAATFAAIYIRRFTQTSVFAIVGGMLYAFSGFSLYNVFFNHFHEAIVFFPLLLIGLEMLMRDGKKGVFCLAVALCATVNYFFFIAMAVFLVPYFLFRAFSHEWNINVRKILCVAFESVVGVMIACVLFLPSILEVLQNSRVSSMLSGWDLILYGNPRLYANIFISIFMPTDMSSYPLYVPNAGTNWASLSAYIPLFSTTGVVAFLISKKGNWLRRLLIFCLIAAFIPALNSAFTMMNAAYYARWFFAPILMMSLATACAFEDPQEFDLHKGIKYTFIITAIIVLVVGFIPMSTVIDGKTVTHIGLFNVGEDSEFHKWNPIRFYANCVLAILSLVIVVILYKNRKNRRRYVSLMLAMTFVICSLSGMYVVFAGRASSMGITSRTEYGLLNYTPDFKDDSYYRVEEFAFESNAPMYWGERSIDCFNSVVPASIMDYYKYIGDKRDVESKPDTQYVATRALLGVKYLADYRGDDKRSNHRFVNDANETAIKGFTRLGNSGNFTVYKNDNYIGQGFVYDSVISQSELDKLPSISRNKDEVMLYGCLLGQKGMSKLKRNYNSISAELDEVDIEEICEKNRKTAVQDFTKTNCGYTMNVNSNGGLCFVSIPYHSGFTAFVDGKQTEIIRANVGFMAVEVEEGTHQIEFKFTPPGLKEGIVFAGSGVVLLLVYAVIIPAIIKRKRKKV